MADLRTRYREALAAFLSELSDIDNETPWQNQEPAWWLEMKRVDRAVYAAKDKTP